jgi:glycosyltransferase involved in cell wall biosynthesis
LAKNDGCVSLNSNRKPLTVALIPAYNEEAAIAKVILQTKRYVSKVIVCDDGSTDMTSEIAKSVGATVLRHQANLGKGVALRTLFAKAKEITPDMAVTLDADGQHDPSEIPNLIKAMRANRADIVVGSRFVQGSNTGGSIPGYRIIGNKLLNRLTDKSMTDTQSGFRVYSRAALNSLDPTENGMGVDSEILMKAKKLNLKVVEAPISVSYDVLNPSKHNFAFHAAEVVMSIVKRSLIQRPFLLYGLPSMTILIIASGLWMWMAEVFISTGHVLLRVEGIAIGVTAIGLLLLIVSMTAELFSRQTRKGLARKRRT